MDWVWDAFWELGSDRSIGTSEGEIPFSAIDRYARRYGINSPDDFEGFRKLIRHLDHLYLSTRNSKQSDTPTVAMDDVAGIKGLLKSLAKPAGEAVDLLALKRHMQAEAARAEAAEKH